MMNLKLGAIASLFVLSTLTVAGLRPAPATANPDSPTKVSWVATKQTYLRVTLSPNYTATGERILNLDLIRHGKLVKRIPAVSGKANVQRFRHGQNSVAGSREPLPQGTYRLGGVDRAPGLPYAMGNTFIPVTPQFATTRSGIGIHRDADRHIAGGPGTIGCLAVLTQTDIDTVADFVATSSVSLLIVDYGLS